MAQKNRLVGIDVAKEKIDAAIRSGAEATFANRVEGHRELLAWLQEHGVGKAVMEASGCATSPSRQVGRPRTTRSTRA
jgi:transposase